MSFFMVLRVALKALTRNKMRTVLTMLGMILGVAAVITMVALGGGAHFAIEEQIRSGGTNLIMVRAGNFKRGGVRGGMGTATTLKVKDLDAIRAQVPGVQYISASVNTRDQVIAGNQNWSTRIEGSGVERRCCTKTLRAWGGLARSSRIRPTGATLRGCSRRSIPRTRRSTAWRTGRPITGPSFDAAM